MSQGELVDIADPSGNYRISILEPHLQGNELNSCDDCIKTNWISSQGKYVSQFEGILKIFIQECMHWLSPTVLVALHLALVALGLEEGTSNCPVLLQLCKFCYTRRCCSSILRRNRS